MASSKSSETRNSLYPEVILSNPDATSPFNKNPTSSSSSSSSSLYPTIDMKDIADNLFPEDDTVWQNQSSPLQQPPYEELLIKIPGAIVHLIERDRSVELACGELEIVSIKQGDTTVAVLARVGDDIQWPLAKDEAAVKLDESHYFFTLHVPGNGSMEDDQDTIEIEKEDEMLNYGVTFASKGQEGLLKEFDKVLENCSAFTVQEVREMGNWEVLDGTSAKEVYPEELNEEEKKEMMERQSSAYWTTLAPNVEDYGGSVARMIAAGSGQLIKGILWCGDVTVDRLKWGNEFWSTRMGKGEKSKISPGAMRRVRRVKRLTKMSERVAVGILSGVVKVTGFFTSPIVNSEVGKKFFSLLPGEIILASLDGFNKVCDAVEVAGRNVMSTTSVVTTGLVSQRYGEQAERVTNDGLDAAGHAIGTAWAVFKIRKALNPKSVFKPTTLAKAVAKANSAELKAKNK
ncbi:EARLY-RESPONSIVE TO DEHYDRATION 7 family protein [Tripterygium wilfordii]|uniref:EARLY-RESPONSIVE TO DEHYDRATION 7 family protein n=1 Tax=Tripterygium wilfordii TaxID=458696 RepID=A0A7J7DGC6_TRIWF|nr:protein EARLY-RESPONSIVE TO DEHYDRATION 7, chloroplastic-like [Tripterygium wilfordii]KAF5745363.1 EARLY-RESPONSIVE TO DEHYDRATION 7 family protein [Tripterygium wilfordii]